LIFPRKLDEMVSQGTPESVRYCRPLTAISLVPHSFIGMEHDRRLLVESIAVAVCLGHHAVNTRE
jgi:hypothetical protein